MHFASKLVTAVLFLLLCEQSLAICGAENQRPCSSVERNKACDHGLLHETISNLCVKPFHKQQEAIEAKKAAVEAAKQALMGVANEATGGLIQNVVEAGREIETVVNRAAQDLNKSGSALMESTNRVAAEQSCRGRIQYKVAWNRAGNTQWNEDNIIRLCAGTRDPDTTINCFTNIIKERDDWRYGIEQCGGGRANVGRVQPAVSYEMECFDMVQGKVAWDGGNSRQWQPGNIHKLCRGTPDPNATVNCFIQHQRQSGSWSIAIDRCKS